MGECISTGFIQSTSSSSNFSMCFINHKYIYDEETTHEREPSYHHFTRTSRVIDDRRLCDLINLLLRKCLRVKRTRKHYKHCIYTSSTELRISLYIRQHESRDEDNIGEMARSPATFVNMLRMRRTAVVLPSRWQFRVTSDGIFKMNETMQQEITSSQLAKRLVHPKYNIHTELTSKQVENIRDKGNP
ncbi:hypothetical protein BJ508DRAFT_303220 [Ascobolus immersus RN42]|uniref:Uncharacterized protein n=1 Tax=Ascobolus immersus RN42 TaxID=1160509 RepID=A0A3N4IHT1_ASCIM|nr:hypothetical protein BJ508DRAFT_303220 [Ascobolus immersus RN42]